MQNLLIELYDKYFIPTPQPEVQHEIEEDHQQLIHSLEKPERRLVLRIIDNKDSICGSRAKESFTCGFWLAWRLFSQLNIYDSGRSLEGILNVGGRFTMPEGEDENEA